MSIRRFKTWIRHRQSVQWPQLLVRIRLQYDRFIVLPRLDNLSVNYVIDIDVSRGHFEESTARSPSFIYSGNFPAILCSCWASNIGFGGDPSRLCKSFMKLGHWCWNCIILHCLRMYWCEGTQRWFRCSDTAFAVYLSSWLFEHMWHIRAPLNTFIHKMMTLSPTEFQNQINFIDLF